MGLVALGLSEGASKGGIEGDSSLGSLALRLILLNSVFLESDLLAHDNVTLDAEVSELASLGTLLMSCLLVAAASGLLLVSELHIWLLVEEKSLVSLQMEVRFGDIVGTESATEGNSVGSALFDIGVQLSLELGHIGIASAIAIVPFWFTAFRLIASTFLLFTAAVVSFDLGKVLGLWEDVIPHHLFRSLDKLWSSLSKSLLY